MITLVVGGTRSGKSTWAEARATALATDARTVVYVATAPEYRDDPDWAARVAAHRARRPASWSTVSTADLADLVADAPAHSVVLIDCLGMWLTRLIDDADAWPTDTGPTAPGPTDAVMRIATAHTDALVDALTQTTAHVICVSNEVGMGIVPMTASGRAFRDALGIVNARVGSIADEVVLLVAGQPLTVKNALS